MQPPPKGITILTSYAHAHKYSEARLASHFLPQPNRKKYPQASHQAPSPWENLDTPASTKSIFCCLLVSSTPSMAAQPPLHVTKTSSGNGIPAIPASAASLEPHPTDQERLLVEVRTIHANLVIRKKSSNNATDGRNVHFYVHGKSSFQIGLFDKLDIVRCLRKTLSSTPLADTLNRTSTCLSLLDVYAGVSNDLLISSPMLVDPKNRVFTAVTTAQKLYGSGYKVDDASDELAT